MLNVGNEVTLTNDSIFIVSGKVIYKNKQYYMMNEKNNINNMMICELESNKLTKIEDKELICLLMPLLLNSLENKLSNK